MAQSPLRLPFPTLATIAAVAIVGPPLFALAFDAFTAASRSPATLAPDLPSYVWTLAIALAIGSLATLLGLPLAFASSGSLTRLAALALLPLATPPFLASSGYGMLRNQAWLTGAWIARLAQNDRPWLPATIDRTLAVLGLAFWAAPIAALILAPAAHSASRKLNDLLNIDSGDSRRRFELVRALGAAPWLSIAGVGVLMIGSAIPLHLARMPTAAVELWAAQDLVPIDKRGSVWLSAWPLIATAVAAGLIAASRLLTPPSAQVDTTSESISSPSLSTRLGVSFVLVIGTAIPLAFFATAISHWSVFAAFFKVHSEALVASLLVSAIVGLLVTLLAILTAHAAADWPTRTTRLVVALFLAAALLPGMMTGALAARVWLNAPAITSFPAWLTDALSLLHAQMLRLGALGVLAGVAFARAESADHRDSRRLDGPRTIFAWWRASGLSAPSWWLITFLAAFMLSLNEIEATVVVQPPSLPSLARKILGDLHFFRTEEMAAAVLVQLAIATAAALTAGFLARRLESSSHSPH